MARQSRRERALHTAGCSHSRQVRCLGSEWSFLTNDTALGHHIDSLYGPCVGREPGPARNVFILRRHARSGPVSLYRNGHPILRRVPENLAVARLVWEVNRGVVEEAGNRLLLHGGPADCDGRVVVLVGPQGSGKSTLITALVCAGLGYVTEETVVIDVSTRTIAPYPKPISLHRDAIKSFGTLDDSFPGALASTEGEELIAAHDIRTDAVAGPGGRARVLVLLSPDRVRRTAAAEQVPRGEAAVALALPPVVCARATLESCGATQAAAPVAMPALTLARANCRRESRPACSPASPPRLGTAEVSQVARSS